MKLLAIFALVTVAASLASAERKGLEDEAAKDTLKLVKSAMDLIKILPTDEIAKILVHQTVFDWEMKSTLLFLVSEDADTIARAIIESPEFNEIVEYWKSLDWTFFDFSESTSSTYNPKYISSTQPSTGYTPENQNPKVSSSSPSDYSTQPSTAGYTPKSHNHEVSSSSPKSYSTQSLTQSSTPRYTTTPRSRAMSTTSEAPLLNLLMGRRYTREIWENKAVLELIISIASVLPMDELNEWYQNTMQNCIMFREVVEALSSPEMFDLIEGVYYAEDLQVHFDHLESEGLNLAKIANLVKTLFSN